MRILMITNHIVFSGGADVAFRLERTTYEMAGHQVSTFSQGPARPLDAGPADYVAIESTAWGVQRLGKYAFNPRVYRALRRVLRTVEPDVVHVHLASKYPLSIYSALAGYPVVQFLHGPTLFCATSWGCLKRDSSPCELGVGLKCATRGCVSMATLPLHWLLHKRVKRLTKRCVKLFITPARYIQPIAERLGFGPVEYVPLGIDPEFCDEPPEPYDGPPTVLYVGALVFAKGVHVLVEAFRLLQRRIPNAKLKLVGCGNFEMQLREQVRNANLETSVDFMGFVGRVGVRRLYGQAHVLAVPSIWNEHFGIVGPEALSCGLPCVGSRLGGIVEWLHDEEFGFLVPPRDEAALADRLATLLLDKNLRLECARRGRKFALANYGPFQFRRNMLRLLDTSSSRCDVSESPNGERNSEPKGSRR